MGRRRGTSWGKYWMREKDNMYVKVYYHFMEAVASKEKEIWWGVIIENKQGRNVFDRMMYFQSQERAQKFGKRLACQLGIPYQNGFFPEDRQGGDWYISVQTGPDGWQMVKIEDPSGQGITGKTLVVNHLGIKDFAKAEEKAIRFAEIFGLPYKREEYEDYRGCGEAEDPEMPYKLNRSKE